MTASSVMTRRFDAVAATMASVRQLRDTMGPSDELIDAVKPLLVELACREELFPAETFPVTAGTTMTIYEVSADPGDRLGLYASAGLPGKYQPPHDHRTWSLIAGVRGAEHNRYFERTTPGGDFDPAVLESRGELVIRRGMVNGMMGDRFHSIEVIEDEPALHLHLYGETLDSLAGRIFYEDESGGVAKAFMSKPNLHTALVSTDELHDMSGDGAPLTIVDGRTITDPNLAFQAAVRPDDVSAPGLRTVVVADSADAAHRVAHDLRRRGVLDLAVLAGGVATSGARAPDSGIRR